MIPMKLEKLFSALRFTAEQQQTALEKLQAQDEINAAFLRASIRDSASGISESRA